MKLGWFLIATLEYSVALSALIRGGTSEKNSLDAVLGLVLGTLFACVATFVLWVAFQ